MFRKNGISGGFITLSNIINNDDKSHNTINQLSLKMASAGFRFAVKNGLQNLYADPKEILEQYKDFDIVKAINERKGQKLLWVRARAIDADVVNANGDYFSKEELLKEVDFKDKKIPAYKTFEGVPVYTNHKNDDIEQAKGMVVYAEWDDKNNCVWTTLFIDEEAYPDIARGIRIGYMHDVSMGCQVEKGKCSICGNIAESEKQYCKHLKNYKGKTDPETNKKVYEENYGLKFIELSIVGDGAFDNCEIDSIFDSEDILEKAVELGKKAQNIHGIVVLADSFIPNESIRRKAIEDCFRQIASTASTSIRLAQAAGTLVGGQLIASEGSGANATVSGILKFLGLDPNAGLNILDLINLALNFLEVAVMNLFARKDSIDLAHVGKITKAMAELQQTMQDMIDDGIDTAPMPGAGVPLNTNQQPATPEPAAPPQQWVPTEEGVGKIIGPGVSQSPAQQSVSPTMKQTTFIPPIMNPSAVGGGVKASTNIPNIVWADTHESIKIVTASAKTNKIDISKTNKLASQLLELGNELGVELNIPSSNIQNTTELYQTNIGGNINMEKLFGSRFAAQRRIKEASQLSMDLNTNDAYGHRITICTDGTVKAYKNDELMDWDPVITEEQLRKMETEDGPAIVANELLKQFREAMASGKIIKKAWQPPTTPTELTQEQQLSGYSGEAGQRRTPPDDVQEKQLEKARNKERTNHPTSVQEEQLDSARTKEGLNHPDNVQEYQIEHESGLYNPKVTDKDIDVKEALLEDARKSVPQDVQEQQLEYARSKQGNASPKKIMSTVIKRLSKIVSSAKITPDEVVEVAEKWVNKESFPELVALARIGNKHRRIVANRIKFHNDAPIKLTLTAALFDQLGRERKITVNELVDGLKVATKNKDATIEAIKNSINKKSDNTIEIQSNAKSKKNMLKAALAMFADSPSEHINKDHIRAVLSAVAMSSQELHVHPKEIIDELDNVNESEIALASTKEAIKERQTIRARNNFWNDMRTASTKDDIHNNIVGWLADYAVGYKLAATDLANATKKIAQNSLAAEHLVKKFIRSAAVQFTDEKITTKRLVCNASDLGVDIKDENLEQTFRDKAIQILSSEGYQIDPQTFSITDLNVMSNGNIEASVTSRFSKTINIDQSQPLRKEEYQPSNTDQIPEITMTPQSSMTNNYPQETIITSAAKKARKASRKQILNRYAQAAGGGMNMNMPPNAPMPAYSQMGNMQTPQSTNMPWNTPMVGTEDTGISSLTGGSEEIPQPEDLDIDSTPEPGTKKPWGTICPQCGSDDVDVTNGEGKCNSCGANLEYTFQVAVKPSSGEKEESDKTKEPKMPEEEFGLGAATAPTPTNVPATPGLGQMPGGMTPPAAGATASSKNKMVRGAMIIAKASWYCDPETFIKVASEGFDKNKSLTLPVGMICPSCGNRNASKIKNKTYCHSCGTIAISKVEKVKNDPTKLRASIEWC